MTGRLRSFLLGATLVLAMVSCSYLSDVNEASAERGRSTVIPEQDPVRNSLYLAEFTDDDGVPVTGANWSLRELAGLAVAEATFTAECMERAGFDYVAPTDAEIALALGSWEPHPFLGLRRFQAAGTLGYHPAEIDLASTPSQQAAAVARLAQDQAAYRRALTGGEKAPVVVIEAADRSGATIERRIGGCEAEVEAKLGNHVNRRLALDLVLKLDDHEAVVVATLAEDSDVVDRIQIWSECVEFRTSEKAATPNELARRFAFQGDEPSARELEIAYEDVECQYLTELRYWYRIAHAREVYALLGEQGSYYDDLGRLRSEVVEIIETELLERRIPVPPLD